MSDLSLPDLPADLVARLAAAGAIDTPSIYTALDADPELRRDLETFVAAHEFSGLLQAFVAASNSSELTAFWQGVPVELEDAFIVAVEQQIAQAQEDGAAEAATGLQARLEDVRQLQSEQRETVAQIGQALTALANVQNDEQLLELWQSIPQELEDTFLNLVESRANQAAQAGNAELGSHLHAQLATLRQFQTVQRQQGEQPPLVSALMAFLQAENDEAARQVFNEQRDLLQSHDAQHLLEEQVRSDDPAMQQHIAARRALLRELHKTAGRPPFRAVLERYLELREAAEGGERSIAAWLAAVAGGEALLAPELADTPDVHWDGLRANLAETYNQFGNALHVTQDLEAVLAAFKRAVTLQPDFAIGQRNLASVLIQLGRLDEAAAALEHARALEPDAPRLAELEGVLEQGRKDER